jgi:hypothetical protein
MSSPFEFSQHEETDQSTVPADAAAELRAKYGENKLVEASAYGHTVVMRKPSQAQWTWLRQISFDERKKPFAAEELFKQCVVWPAKPQVDAMLDEYPALADNFGNVLVDYLGMNEKARVRKF